MKQPQFDLPFFLDLLRIPSVTADSAAVARAVEAMRAHLVSRGLSCAVERAPDGRPVLYASVRGGEKAPAVLLNAHLDVVPAPAALFEPRVDGDSISGRGVNDCKGNAVAIAAALEALAGGDASVGAVFSTDEETGGASAATMASLGYRARSLAIVIDALPDSIVYAQKGMATFRLVARGRGAHSSAPWTAVNPIDILFAAWARAAAAFPAVAREGDNWHDTLAATVVRAGQVENQIPDTAEMLVNARFTEPGALERIEETLRSATGLEVSLVRSCPPVFCDRDDPALRALAATMEKVSGKPVRFERMDGATDARHFASGGVPVAIVGTAGSGCHTDSETASLSSLSAMAETIVEFARAFPAG